MLLCGHNGKSISRNIIRKALFFCFRYQRSRLVTISEVLAIMSFYWYIDLNNNLSYWYLLQIHSYRRPIDRFRYCIIFHSNYFVLVFCAPDISSAISCCWKVSIHQVLLQNKGGWESKQRSGLRTQLLGVFPGGVRDGSEPKCCTFSGFSTKKYFKFF